jgi:NADH-quinone oxidoreductase subunit J
MSVTILFYLLGFLALASALGMISVRQPVQAALFFIVTLLSVGGLFALLSNTFLFMVQVILYAGAIITLLLFIIMFLGVNEHNIPKEPKRFKTMFLVMILMLPFAWTTIEAVLGIPGSDISIILEDFGSIKAVGMQLFTNWIFPFELISILLLIALLGAVTLGKGSRRHD